MMMMIDYKWFCHVNSEKTVHHFFDIIFTYEDNVMSR